MNKQTENKISPFVELALYLEKSLAKKDKAIKTYIANDFDFDVVSEVFKDESEVFIFIKHMVEFPNDHEPLTKDELIRIDAYAVKIINKDELGVSQ